MDLENQEPTADAAKEPSAPRKRAPRRVVSSDAPAEKTAAEPAASDDVEQKPRRRRAPAKSEDQAEKATTESSDANGEAANGEEGDDNGGGYNRNRNRGRGRDRRRGGRSSFSEEGEPEISDDDVLIPIGGILDVLDNYAFVRTQGYLPGPTDVYVSLGQVKKYNLRKGDAVIGAIRQPRDGEHHPLYQNDN